MKKLIGSATLLGIVALVPSTADATIIIDGTTQGFYNQGLGDLSLDSVLGVQTDAGTGFNLFPIANSAAGDPTIPPVATEPNLGGADASTQANLGDFLANTSALGGTWSAASQAIPSTWTVNSETAIVYELIVGPAGLTNLFVQLGVDNGVYAWFDGAYQFGAMRPGGASAFEYSFNTGPVAPGTHYLQLLREDHGGGTGWFISADAIEGTVPAPTMTLLFGLAFVALARHRTRR